MNSAKNLPLKEIIVPLVPPFIEPDVPDIALLQALCQSDEKNQFKQLHERKRK